MGSLFSTPTTNTQEEDADVPKSPPEASKFITEITHLQPAKAPETPVQESSLDPPLLDDDAQLGKEKTEESPEILEEDREEGECGFCVFMKGGGCKDSFIEWEECVAASEFNEEDSVNNCREKTLAMMACLRAHPEYYGPIVRSAEELKEAEADQEVDKEKPKEEAEAADDQASVRKGENEVAN